MMQKFRYTVEIEAESADLAERALWERIGPDEDYGFDYTIGLVPASSTTASNTTADSSTTGTLREAIERIQRMRDEASAYFEENDVPGKWLDEHGSWKDWESESDGSAAEAEVQTFDRVLDVLTALAHGLTPAQGGEES